MGVHPGNAKDAEERRQRNCFIRASLLYLESEKEFRKELLESGTLEGVVLLPEGLLMNTGIQIAMLVLSENNNRVKMVNAASYYEKIKIPEGAYGYRKGQDFRPVF